MMLYLQQYIYQLLSQKLIRDKVNGVYYQVPTNNPFPYIYIGDFHAKDISTKGRSKLQISFKLSIYSRDKSLKAMLELAEIVKKTLHINGEMMMKCHEEKIILQNDGLTQQIMLMFKSVILERGEAIAKGSRRQTMSAGHSFLN